MINPKDQTEPKFTISGTNIEEVKQKNAQSGLSYNEAKELLAKKKNTTTHE
jgi:hypothetical protein